MYTCKPAKRSMILIYLLCAAAAVGLTFLTNVFEDFLKSVGFFILLAIWAISAVFMLILIPLYYKKTKFFVSDEDIVKYTFLFNFKYQYMTMDSVKSITSLITPFSRFTGLNFIMINALGARIILPMLNKKDCNEISEFINQIISGRSKYGNRS